MSIAGKKYELKFVNVLIAKGGYIEKSVHGKNVPGFSFSPLSEYLFFVGHYDGIDDILIEITAAINGQPFDDGISAGTETVTLTPTMTTIHNSDGRTQSLPTSDLKAVLEEYKTFLNTPPLNGSIVKQ